MNSILVTGGTGKLGRPTVDLLREAGHDVRVLSRSEGPGRTVGDLANGAGLDGALTGIDTVLHLATTSRKDSGQTKNLVDAAARAGVAHLIYISIVGVDKIPFPYYVDKLECERIIESSGLQYTILRATQFHEFVAMILRPQRRLPVTMVPKLSVQPIAIEEVAARLVELAAASGPAGRVQDIGGPERLTGRELATIWNSAQGRSGAIWSLALPGRIFATYAAGHHMTPLPGYGKKTFGEYAAEAAK